MNSSRHLKRHVEKYCRRGEKMKSVYPAKDPRLYIVKRDARGLFCCPHQGGCEGAFQTRVALVHHFCTKHDRRKCPYCFKVFSYLWVSVEEVVVGGGGVVYHLGGIQDLTLHPLLPRSTSTSPSSTRARRTT